MANDDDAAKAIAALDGKEVGGRNLKVNEARPKEGGSRPGGSRPGGSNYGRGGGNRGGSGGGNRGGGRGDRFSHEDYRESARQPREPRW